MSALSFKINAETDKLKSFITMLERLRQVLAEIPDSTKEFDVINRKIGEMEARVEQTMRKIAQMEQQAMDAASKATASATTGTAGGSSTPGTAATQAETAAYHELIEELRAVNASKRENVALISQYEAQIKRLKSKIIDLNKTESSGIKLTQDQKASRLNASVSIEEYKQALSRARQELANQIKLEQVARGSIDEVSQALGRMRTIYRSLNESERGSNWGQNLLKNIEGLDAKVKELDASMGVHTRNVGNYASGFNMLGFQIQQVARELPSLAYGPQIFFSAISNNLPMLADEIARAKKSVDELKKAGQTFTPVWKQIASSIFSWQTLLVAGVTVLTLYGKEITNWVASLFKGKTTIDASAAALERFNSAMAQGSVSAQSELTKLNLLYRAATDLSRPYEERAEAVKKLQDIYPAYFGNMAAEQVMVGNAVGAYENLRDAIIEVAKAKAAEKIITENQENINLLEATGNAYIDYVSAYKDYEDAWNNQQKLLKKYKTGEISKEQLGAGLRYFNAAKESVWEATDNLKTELQKLSGGKDLWDKIEKEYDSNVREYVNSVDKTNAQLVPVAEKLFVGKTPAELNAEWKKARQEAKSAAEKAASDQERNLKELDKQLQKLRDDALQAEVDSMKEGTARKLAQIDLDYQKRARAIQEAEERIRELQGGELTKGQQAQIKALNDANNAQRTEERASVSSISISPEGLASTINKNIQSWNEYLKAYGTFREKLQATKDIYDRKIENAGSIGERKTLEAERDAAVAEIEEQAGQWVRELTDKTKKQLADLKTELEASLQSLESEYNALDSSDTEQAQKLRGDINQTRARINAVDKAASSTKLAPKDNAIKKWQRLERTLGDIADGFEGIGDAVGGTTGEVISAAGEIATNAASMISSIVTLTESSAAAITTTSTTAASAIKAVERASVILAIIQAVLTIATKIASLFNNDDEKQAEIDRLQGRIEQLQWELDNANAIRLQENSFNAIQKVKDAYNDATKAILSAYGKLSPFGEAIVKRINAAKIEEKAIKSIADAYSNLKYTDSNLLGENKFSDTRDKLNNLAEQQLLLQKQINAENDKKKTDKSKIKEWERQIQELGAEAAEMINEVVETIIGGTAEEIAKELGDAFIDAFMEGENAAEAWGEKVDEIVANIVRQMLISRVLEEEIGKVFDKYKAKWFKDGVFLGMENVTDSMSGFADDLNKVGETFQAVWDSLPAETKELLGNAGAARQEATERGFKAMSQDTGDELNGRFTDIQGKVTDIRGYVMAQTQSIIGLLTSMANIETAMYASVQVNNELLRYAVMTYMEIVEINGNTAAMRVALQGIQEDIAAIKRNTSEL
jgi:DNA repair exonuclease SbcCD ATPase subunit